MTTVIAAILGLITGAGIYQWGHKEGVKSQHWKIADLEEIILNQKKYIKQIKENEQYNFDLRQRIGNWSSQYDKEPIQDKETTKSSKGNKRKARMK
jgi:hypothetical protein